MDIVTLLLVSKANVDLKDTKGETALEIALTEGHGTVCSLIQERDSLVDKYQQQQYLNSFSKEVQSFHQELLSASNLQNEARQEAMRRLQVVCETIFSSNFQLRLFGSSTTGLCGPDSDLDVGLYLPRPQDKALEDLCRALDQATIWFSHVEGVFSGLPNNPFHLCHYIKRNSCHKSHVISTCPYCQVCGQREWSRHRCLLLGQYPNLQNSLVALIPQR